METKDRFSLKYIVLKKRKVFHAPRDSKKDCFQSKIQIVKGENRDILDRQRLTTTKTGASVSNNKGTFKKEGSQHNKSCVNLKISKKTPQQLIF